jgi:TonB family protein
MQKLLDAKDGIYATVVVQQSMAIERVQNPVTLLSGNIMNIANKRLSWALAASALLHLALIMTDLGRPAAVGTPGRGTLSVHLTTASTPAQSPSTRPDIDILPDVRVTWSPNSNKNKATRPPPPGGTGGNQRDTTEKISFNDNPSHIGQYHDLPLPSDDLSIPYLPPVLPWEISPHYPDAAFAARTKGYVRLELLIDRIGEVVSARVMESQPPGVFDDAAWQAFHKARFQPAYEYGQPVASQASVKVVFDPDDEHKPRPRPTAMK